MNRQKFGDSRLSRIETLWSVVRRAHDGSDETVRGAQQQLLDRYGRAVRRYLLGVLRNGEAADELFQEFALRFVNGDFRAADPSRGRFRNYVKTTLFHLIVDYRRRSRKRPQELRGDEPADAASAADFDEEEFLQKWREHLLDRCWTALAERERHGGSAVYTALRMRVDEPELPSHAMAERLSEQLNKPHSPGAARVLLHRARQLFADQLVEEVRHSLDSASFSDVEDELRDLHLLEYCRGALHRKRSEWEGDPEAIPPRRGLPTG